MTIIISSHLIFSSALSSTKTPNLSLTPLIHLSTLLISQTHLEEIYIHLFPDETNTGLISGSKEMNAVRAKSMVMWDDLIKVLTSWPLRVGNV